jgi:hypothetical protein
MDCPVAALAPLKEQSNFLINIVRRRFRSGTHSFCNFRRSTTRHSGCSDDRTFSEKTTDRAEKFLQERLACKRESEPFMNSRIFQSTRLRGQRNGNHAMDLQRYNILRAQWCHREEKETLLTKRRQRTSSPARAAS